MVAGVVIGATAVSLVDSGDPAPTSAVTPTSAATATSPEPAETTAAPADVTEPQPPASDATTPPPTTAPPAGVSDPVAVAEAIGPIPVPSDCGLPLDVPESMPGADRSYRGGVHEGIDFICRERGRQATTPLPGRVLLAERTYEDPEPSDRQAVLAIGKELGRTPPWILAMMFGRFVVIDHGIIPGAGNVVTIYAHLEEVDAAMQAGAQVPAGARVGEIGRRGTESGGTGADNPNALHLHWEIHVDERYLGEGSDIATTRATYAALFDR